MREATTGDVVRHARLRDTRAPGGHKPERLERLNASCANWFHPGMIPQLLPAATSRRSSTGGRVAPGMFCPRSRLESSRRATGWPRDMGDRSGSAPATGVPAVRKTVTSGLPRRQPRRSIALTHDLARGGGMVARSHRAGAGPRARPAQRGRRAAPVAAVSRAGSTRSRAGCPTSSSTTPPPAAPSAGRPRRRSSGRGSGCAGRGTRALMPRPERPARRRPSSRRDAPRSAGRCASCRAPGAPMRSRRDRAGDGRLDPGRRDPCGVDRGGLRPAHRRGRAGWARGSRDDDREAVCGTSGGTQRLAR